MSLFLKIILSLKILGIYFLYILHLCILGHLYNYFLACLSLGGEHIFLEHAKVDGLMVNTEFHSILHKTWHIFGSLSIFLLLFSCKDMPGSLRRLGL